MRMWVPGFLLGVSFVRVSGGRWPFWRTCGRLRSWDLFLRRRPWAGRGGGGRVFRRLLNVLVHAVLPPDVVGHVVRVEEQEPLLYEEPEHQLVAVRLGERRADGVPRESRPERLAGRVHASTPREPGSQGRAGRGRSRADAGESTSGPTGRPDAPRPRPAPPENNCANSFGADPRPAAARGLGVWRWNGDGEEGGGGGGGDCVTVGTLDEGSVARPSRRGAYASWRDTTTGRLSSLAPPLLHFPPSRGKIK